MAKRKKEDLKGYTLDEMLTETYGQPGTKTRDEAEQRIAAIAKQLPIQRGAIISECQQYRYKLWRIWDPSKPSVLFIMLNPSTADEKEDDPTIRRCMRFAQAWGYGGIYVGNLYAFRTKKPAILRQMEKDGVDIVGKQNDEYIKEMCRYSKLVIFAWGASMQAHHFAKKRMVNMRHFMGTGQLPHILGKSKHGFPSHPLMLKKNVKPTLF